jgi:hypothetical protein
MEYGRKVVRAIVRNPNTHKILQVRLIANRFFPLCFEDMLQDFAQSFAMTSFVPIPVDSIASIGRFYITGQ